MSRVENPKCKKCNAEMSIIGVLVQDNHYIYWCPTCKDIRQATPKRTETLYESKAKAK